MLHSKIYLLKTGPISWRERQVNPNLKLGPFVHEAEKQSFFPLYYKQVDFFAGG